MYAPVLSLTYDDSPLIIIATSLGDLRSSPSVLCISLPLLPPLLDDLAGLLVLIPVSPLAALATIRHFFAERAEFEPPSVLAR